MARNWTQNADMSEDDKLRTYAEMRAKYQHQRRTGEYRDDQGWVKRS